MSRPMYGSHLPSLGNGVAYSCLHSLLSSHITLATKPAHPPKWPSTSCAYSLTLPGPANLNPVRYLKTS